MKKIIYSIVIAAMVTACGTEPAVPESKTQKNPADDSIALTDYNDWKAKQEQPASQQNFESEGVKDIPPAPETTPAPAVIYREAPVKKPRLASVPEPVKETGASTPAAAAGSIAKVPAPASDGATRGSYGRGSNDTEETSTGGSTEEKSEASGNANSNDGDGAVSAPAEAPAKKDGMSKATKGGVIGGASGAVLGAIFSKNKAKGAVIGGVVGAAGGYIFGRSKDKQDGKKQ